MKSKVLEFFIRTPEGNIGQLVNHLGCSRRTAERLVAELKRSGELLREGSVRAGRWIVVG